MKKALLDDLKRVGYGDLVRASWQRLIDLRESLSEAMTDDTVPPNFPTHVQVQTIAGCNANCPMCPMSDHDMRVLQKGRMSSELFAKIVGEAAQQEECSVVSPYLQNEPLLDPDLSERIGTIKKLSDDRLSARIVTNGYLLDGEHLEDLLSAGIDVVSVSLNAHSPDTYRKVMGGLELSRTLDNIERLLDRAHDRVMIMITFMVTSDNETEIDEAVAYWSSRGVHCGGYNIGTMTGNIPSFESLKPTTAVYRPLECFVPLEATSILANGDMLLCCSDWARHSVYGNVRSQSIHEIWHSEPLARIRRNAIGRRFEHQICRKCLGQTKSPANLAFEGGGEQLTVRYLSENA